MVQNKSKGFGVTCDLEGRIINVLFDKLNQESCIKTGKPFSSFFYEGSQHKAVSFLEKIRDNYSAYDWELNLFCNKEIIIIDCSGFLMDDKIWIFGACSKDDIFNMVEDLTRINNEQTNVLRDVMKNLTRHMHKPITGSEIGSEVNLYDELGRLNNELTNAQRELTKKNIQLTELNQQKEMLLKEIHHRVKNNLMIISSLLNIQSRYLKDEESKEIFRESQNRAKSMALIHERLYRSTDLKNIDFKEYITTLANDLYRTYVKDPLRVSLQLDIPELSIDINAAIPLGLILNELITNSMKYAFLGDEKGKVYVVFTKKDGSFILRVGDDGVGFPDDVDYKNTGSLGLQLVNSLTEQLDGKLELDSSKGTEFKIIFKDLSL